MATPFRKKRFTFTQPDGSKIEVIGSGDQHYAVFETLDGYTVVRNPATGFYEYAVRTHGDLKPSGLKPGDVEALNLPMDKNLRDSPEAVRSKVMLSPGLPVSDSRWMTRRKQKKEVEKMMAAPGIEGVPNILAAPPERETIGEFVGLCILIDFPDVRGSISAEEVERFCNQRGYTGFGNNGSVRDYFFENSMGKLDYINRVTIYYTAKQNKAYYTDPDIPQPTRAIELITEALDSFKSRGLDFSRYTSDSDDFIYALNVFYAGEVENRWAEGLWPHSFHLNSPYDAAPGKKIFDYQITDIGQELSLGTFCHENGHMICDFPDLYDYGSDSSGVGVYCLMCAGGIRNEKNPGNIGAYLKYEAGWATKAEPITQGNYHVQAGTNDFFIHRKDAEEYYIIENRINTKRDSVLPGSGLAIWHVDITASNNNQQMTMNSHYECSLIQADGRNDLERDTNNLGDAADLFTAGARFGNNSTPRSQWWDGSFTGKEINVVSDANSTIYFSVQ